MAQIATNTQYESIRGNLNPSFEGMSDQELETVLRRSNIDAEAMEGIFGDIGKFAANLAPTVLPIAGKVVGGIYGGPAGAAVGGQLGSLAGGAISNLAGGHAAAPAGASAGAPAAPAAGQLLQTIARPETLQALASMAMGVMGKPSVGVGGTQVPISAFSNLLGTLLGRAEAEYGAALAQDVGSVPSYMRDYAGGPKGDPAIAAHRAEALYELLSSNEAVAEAEGAFESAESGEAIGEWESEADAAEMLEMAEGYESEEY